MGLRKDRSPEEIVRELKRRARHGGPTALRSGSNRGDWLYAAAVKHFGSWKKAVEDTGHRYADIAIRPYTAQEVKQRIRAIAAAGERTLASREKRLSAAASRLFGSWKAALEAAGCADRYLIWPKTRVIETIHRRESLGLDLNTMAVLRDDRFLYRAARLRFGNWAIAFKAALGRKPVRVNPASRPKKVHSAKKIRH